MAPPQLNLLLPPAMIFLGLVYLPITILHLLTTGQFHKLFSLKAFKDAWFGRFWVFFGPKSRALGFPSVEPLLAKANGVVLDIGPGDGQWMDLFSRANNKNHISRIYGVEPNAELHAGLRRRVQEAGLEGVYEILPVGVESLDGCGIEKGSVDTIVTVQVLCSVPDPQKILKELYPYLKPGGQWLVYEHVRTKYRDAFVARWQESIDVVWPHMFDGCNLSRPTDEWLLQTGEWDEVDLRSGEDEGKYAVVPHAIGRLVKRR